MNIYVTTVDACRIGVVSFTRPTPGVAAHHYLPNRLDLGLATMPRKMRVSFAATVLMLVFSIASGAQDLMGLDVTSDAFTKADTTRASIEADLAKLKDGAILDLRLL